MSGYRITIEYESDEPMTFGGDAGDDREVGRTWISEVRPPSADAPPEVWAEFGDRLAWATRSIG